ncbi:hypothetical protein [Acetatifactor muris]|uniref:hypothetical protein n=1 Tax=Acetatifactor muris TaxID=879566 RepID=UPI0023F49E0D|nr:hypothetical protein [Acetatifactor muris]
MRRIQTASYGYASFLKTEEQRKAREELADELMRFVNEAFGEDKASDSAEAFQEEKATGVSEQNTDGRDVSQTALIPEVESNIDELSERHSQKPFCQTMRTQYTAGCVSGDWCKMIGSSQRRRGEKHGEES